MKKTLLMFALFCAISLGFTSCKDAEADGKEAAAAYCRIREIDKGLVKTNVQKKEKDALFKKMNNIRKRYLSKTTRSFDKKFEDAFEKYKAECR